MVQFQVPNLDSEESTFSNVGNFVWEISKVFFWALIIIVPIRVFLFQPFFVQGASMEPNFENGDYLIVNELGYKTTKIGTEKQHFFTVNSYKELSRGDVVVFRYPKNPDQFFIKRVIALPGERIEVASGKVKIYNEQHPEGMLLEEEMYLSEDNMTTGAVTAELGEEEYFVMGDNRDQSHDSRAWGPVHADEVIGKVLIRAWPLSKVEIF